MVHSGFWLFLMVLFLFFSAVLGGILWFFWGFGVSFVADGSQIFLRGSCWFKVVLGGSC